MLFIVRVGTVIPQTGPMGGGGGAVIGVARARSKNEAAHLLGLIRWDGWKNIPSVNATAWKKWAREYFFTPFDTRRIDQNPGKYTGANWRMRIITLHPTKELRGKIPPKVWRAF